jgi:hypothetical protein
LFVQKITALIGYFPMGFRYALDGFLPSMRTTLFPGKRLLSLLQMLFCPPIVAWVLYGTAI